MSMIYEYILGTCSARETPPRSQTLTIDPTILSEEETMVRPGADVLFTSWACCDTLSKTYTAKESQKPFSMQPHIDLDFTISEVRKHITGEMHYHLIAKEKQRRRFYIAFKGTSTFNDALTDVQIYRDMTQGPGSVHSGFVARANQITVDPIIDLLNNDCTVIVTGYSLGGAVALLVLFRILKHDRARPNYWLERGLLQCVTFGAPYVGDEAYLQPYLKYRKVIHNLVNSRDIVPTCLAAPAHELGILATLFVPEYRPIGRFHTVQFDECLQRITVTWDGAPPAFKRQSSLVRQIQDHLCYYQGLLQALGDPATHLVTTSPVSVTLGEVCPQVSRVEWDQASASIIVYGLNLHKMLSLAFDGLPGKPTMIDLVNQTLGKFAVGRDDVEGMHFSLKSHLPFHTVHGGVAYTSNHVVQVEPYCPAPERFQMVTLSQLLVGQIAMRALRCFTSGKFDSGTAQDLVETVDRHFTAANGPQGEIEQRAFDIISVVAIQRLHTGDSSLVERLFQSNPRESMIRILNPTVVQDTLHHRTSDLANYFDPTATFNLGDSETVEAIRNLNTCIPDDTPRPVPVAEVLQKLADLGFKYQQLVGQTLTVDAIRELDALEKQVQFHLQCMQCTWLAFSVRLYWQQLHLALIRDHKRFIIRTFRKLRFWMGSNPSMEIDYKYETRVEEMARALDVSFEDKKFEEVEHIISGINMPSPANRAEWGAFIAGRQMLQFCGHSRHEIMESELRVYKTMSLIKVIVQTRASATGRFIVAVLGPTKAGKGTLSHNALGARSQFGLNLNSIAPRMYDVSGTTRRWVEDLSLAPGKGAPSFELVDMPSVDDRTAAEGRNQFQFTNQLCPFLGAVVVLLKSPGLNDAGVNRLLEIVKRDSRCKVLLTIGHLARFWDEVTVMNEAPSDLDLDNPNDTHTDAADTGGQAERAATAIRSLLEKLNIDAWGDRLEIVLTDVRYKTGAECASTKTELSPKPKYDQLVEKLSTDRRPFKFFYTYDIRMWLKDRFVEYCTECGIAAPRPVAP